MNTTKKKITTGSKVKKANAENIFARLAKTWPDAKCELLYNTPFQLLLAVLLSAQATDISVNKALLPLLKSYPEFSPLDLLKMGQVKFLEIIRSIGLAPTKARNSLAMAAKLVTDFNGQVPRTREELETLPGVGRKTANVILNVLYGEPAMAVDTHVSRVSQRMGLVEQTSNRLQIEDQLKKVVPKEFAVIAHHLLIFHGRYLCTARSPQCERCPLIDDCPRIGV